MGAGGSHSDSAHAGEAGSPAAQSGGSVFLLSDYGYSDEFAGVMRAVIQRDAPGAPVVDITHGIPPFDVRAGARCLERAVDHLGRGVVVAVVDPGVGSARRGIALLASSSGQPSPHSGVGPAYFVGPDNGLLMPALKRMGGVRTAVALAPGVARPGGSSTFDGRDLFAPVAALLWSGASIEELGDPVDPATLVDIAEPFLEVSAGSLTAEVTWIDGFGNVQLAARLDDAESCGIRSDPGRPPVRVSVIRLPGRQDEPGDPARGDGEGEGQGEGEGEGEGLPVAELQVRLVGSFAAIAPADAGLVIDANLHLAISCREQSAADLYGIRVGDRVVLSAGGGAQG